MSSDNFTQFVLISLFFRPEMVVGWYHSHPGFGCWLSGVDINTQQVMPALYGTVSLQGIVNPQSPSSDKH